MDIDKNVLSGDCCSWDDGVAGENALSDFTPLH